MTYNNVKIISDKEIKPIIKELKKKFGNKFLDQYRVLNAKKKKKKKKNNKNNKLLA
jgi:uncharacterized protein (DUF2249 family)